MNYSKQNKESLPEFFFLPPIKVGQKSLKFFAHPAITKTRQALNDHFRKGEFAKTRHACSKQEQLKFWLANINPRATS